MSSFLVLKKKFDLGGSSGTSMLVGKRRVEIPIPEPDLPYDAQVEYLESTGTQWIDTGILPTSELGADFKFNVTQLTSDSSSAAYWSPAIGADEGWPSGNGFGIHIRANNIKFGSQIYNYSFNTNVDYVVNLQNKTININDQQIVQSSETFSASRSIYLFANNRNNQLQTSIVRFYYCKLYQNGTLVCDLIPVRVGNVGYMYDKVSKELFANAGSGSFTLGGDVVPIEYIESTGTQWIDTGITPTEKTSAQFKVYNKVWTGFVIFGYMLENDNRDWRIFNYNNNIYLDIISSRLNTSGGTAWTAGSWRELEMGNNYVKDLQTDQTILNGSTVGSFTGDHTITLNNFHDKSYSQNKWSYVKIYEDDILVRDMIPVRIGQTGYMYDTVSSRLFGNDGSGNFVLGDDINKNLVAFANDGTAADSCFKCALPSGYSPVGTTMTFWGKNLGRSSAMTVDNADASFFYKLGNASNGVGLSWQIDNVSDRLSLLKEGVIWQNTAAASLDSWHHYAVVYNSSSNIQVYIDGQLKTSGGNSIISPTEYFALGGYAAPAYYNGRYCVRTLNGSIARVAIFNSALLQAQVQADMALGSELPQTSQLQHLWAYSEKDEVGDWNLTQVSPAYISRETPWKTVQTIEESEDQGDLPVVTVLKKHFDVDVDVSFDSVGGSECESATYTLGKTYGLLPDTVKAQNIFNGWYTAPYDAEVEYLESDGAQYIDTGIYADTNTIGFMLDGTFLTSTTDDSYPCLGCYGDAGINDWFGVYEENGYIVVGGTANIKLTRYINQRITYTGNYFNDRLLSTSIGRSGTINSTDIPVYSTAKFMLFAEGFDDGSVGCFAKARLYAAKLTKGSQLIRDFIPVRVGQTGYMYDKVSGQLFGNGGSRSFAYGNDIPGSSSTHITEDSLVRCDINTLYAHWEYVDITEDRTEYVVQATSSYKKTGVYAANRYSSSQPVYIDWGDGSVAKIEGNISQLTHEYSSAGTYNVKISNNLTSFAPSYSNSTWYGTTSQNRYTLKDVAKVGSRVSTMPTYAFYYCSALSSVDFLSEGYGGLTAIPNYAFYYCQSIQSLSSLPSRIKNIGQYAFRYCAGLNGIQDLRNSGLTGITGAYALANCSNVKEWKLPDTLTAQYFGNAMFINNSNLSAISLPNSLTSISQQCFYGCSQLKSIEIPANVRQINTQAFYVNEQLTSVTYLGNQLTSIGGNAFYQCSRLISPSIPYSVQRIEDKAFSDCYQLSGDLALPSSLTFIGNYAYKCCQSLKSLSIQSSLTSIGEYAFAGCDGISSISAYGMEAPSVYVNTFGNTSDGETSYTGYSTRGQNTLYAYVAADGYENGGWLNPLQSQDKCGFNMQFIDPENVHYCEVTLDARAGSVSPSSLTCIQGKKMLSLPTPTAPPDLPSFSGWFTERHGEGDMYTAQSTVPSQSTLTLYAYYTEAPDTSITVDLNDSWRVNTNDNPDPSTYDMYESYSNQYSEGASLAMMKIHSSGCTQLSVWIRSYAESDYDYCVAFYEDFDAYNTDWDEYTDYSFEWINFNDLACTKSSTSGSQNSGTSLESYMLVTYDLDGGEHDVWIAHRKDGSVDEGSDQSYILIPKSSGAGGDADDGIYLEDGETQLYDENQVDQTVQED